MDKVCIARGTLYYHFKSKEDILNGLVDRYKDKILSEAKKIEERKEIPIVERIIKIILSMKVSVKGSKEVQKQMHKPQNALLHQKIQRAIIYGVTPILAEVASEGIQQGIIHTLHPYESMEMVMIYANTIFDDLFEFSQAQQAHKIKSFVYNVERLFGVKEGSLSSIMQIFGQ